MDGLALSDVTFREFGSEEDLEIVMTQMKRDLSEPYPIFTYRYFV